MSHIIGLGSIRPNGVNMVYVQAREFEDDTVFKLERILRTTVAQNPRAEWSQIMKNLECEGFTAVLQPRDNSVFIHSRPWDEHLTGNGQSFFVSFPLNAPYELAGKILLATPNPLFYTAVSEAYLGPNQFLLINNEHDPVYPDDQVWLDIDHDKKCPIGAIFLIREQFPNEDAYSLAIRALTGSGYQIMRDEEEY